jgi:hypothetical protein
MIRELQLLRAWCVRLSKLMEQIMSLEVEIHVYGYPIIERVTIKIQCGKKI